MRQSVSPTSLALDAPSPRPPSACPVEDWMAFLGHRWTALILWHLQEGPKRHGELVECLPGVTPKILSERLQSLEQRRLVSRTPLATFPRGVLYALTPAGKDLVGILDQVEAWSKARVPIPRRGQVFF